MLIFFTLLMKKGISPILATVLLVGLTVALIAGITSWALNLKESTTRFAEQQQQLLTLEGFSFEVLNVEEGERVGGGNKTIKITIINNENYKIYGFISVEYDGNDKNIGTLNINDEVNPYETKIVRTEVLSQTAKLRLIPIVKLDKDLLTLPNVDITIRIP